MQMVGIELFFKIIIFFKEAINKNIFLDRRRMKGESVLWIPGTDHAGIATQVAVEKQINAKLKLTKHDLGRDEFIKKVWEWKEEKEEKIIKQLRQMGASLDWSRQMFTMDPVSI